MFYKKGIDITNDKSMFNFLKSHEEYYIYSSWNCRKSIANNVKLHNLDLSGDWCVAYDFLTNGGYDTIYSIIEEWKDEHEGYDVYFNGRSDGYLVLCDSTCSNYHNVLPTEIAECVDYDEYKRWCKEYYGSVKANRPDLVYYTKLVQDFDKLCDDLRNYCDELSTSRFEVHEMKKVVDEFNCEYSNDLEYLGFNDLVCDENGNVDISEINKLSCLLKAFTDMAERHDSSYKLFIEDNLISYKNKFD